MAVQFTNGKFHGFNDDGTPMVGGLLYTYVSGTTTPQATYTDSTLGTPNTNPVVLDARGEASVWLGTSAYTMKLTTSVGALVWTEDGVIDSSGSFSAALASAANGSGADLVGGVGRVVTNITALRALLKTGVGKAFVLGYYASGDGGGGQYYYDASDTTSSDNGGTIIVANDGGRWKAVVTRVLYAEMFGCKGDDSTDNTASITALIAYAATRLPCTIRFGRGTFRYTDLGNLAYTGLTIEGVSDEETVLKCTNSTASHKAIYIDAFQAGLTGNDATAPFIMRCNLRNLTVQGNANTASIIYAQGLARCNWENVRVREADHTAGIGFNFFGFMLSRFSGLACSTNLDTMSNIPSEGLRLSAGTRNAVSVGNCSNNTFVGVQAEGLTIGWRIVGGDQNVFLGGTPEANSSYGLLVGSGCRYNTFIGCGFENTGVTNADVSDAGNYNAYLNCYSNVSVRLQGLGLRVEGGYFERIDVQGTAVACTVKSVHVNNWATGSGGFVDSGTGTNWKNVYDVDSSTFVYPYKSRTAITVGASPFTWLNTTGQYVEVAIQSGTVTQVQGKRSADTWLRSTAVPGTHLVAPNDSLVVSYSVLPVMSYVPHNGFQG